jgi:RimJ/RimL family protein N-acetyltransferase
MLELIKVERTDAEKIYNAWGQCGDNFAYLTASTFKIVADAQNYIDAILSNELNLAFHVVDTKSKNIVGIIKASIMGHKALVGYVIHQPYWGKGFATEAVKRVTAMLENDPNITRVWATCALENTGSIRVLEKCGYEQECILKSWVVYPAQGTNAADNYSYIKLIRR